MRRTAPYALLVLCACSGPWRSPELGLEMELPKGYSEAKLSGKVADFGNGLQIARVDEALPALGSVPHDEQAKTALTQIPTAKTTTVTSRREGDIGGAKLLRFDLKDGNTRGLLYVVPRGSKYFVLYADASGNDADAKLNRVERAFGTLKFGD